MSEECACLSRVEGELKASNTRLQVTFMLNRERSLMRCAPILATEKIEPRGKRKLTVVATFCPFCGTRYAPAFTAHQTEGGERG